MICPFSLSIGFFAVTLRIMRSAKFFMYKCRELNILLLIKRIFTTNLSSLYVSVNLHADATLDVRYLKQWKQFLVTLK